MSPESAFNASNMLLVGGDGTGADSIPHIILIQYSSIIEGSLIQTLFYIIAQLKRPST